MDKIWLDHGFDFKMSTYKVIATVHFLYKKLKFVHIVKYLF